MIIQLPIYTENVFGEPGGTLSGFQRTSYAVRLLLNENKLTMPVSRRGDPIIFNVSIGEPINSIANRLETEGLIQDGRYFQLYLVYKGMDISVQAGQYSISPSMNAVEIAHLLQDATPDEVEFVILAGWRMEEIADSLPTSGLNISATEFLQAVKNPKKEKFENEAGKLLTYIPENATLEGYLFPGSYTLQREASIEDLLSIILSKFYSEVFLNLGQEFQKQGFSLHQAVTLASITQREAIIDDEQSLITSVFINRLNQGMKLESDPTAQYAIGYNDQQLTWWTNPLSMIDIEINSPYNTYIYSGLPPGPICSPGLPALKSVAYTIDTPYIYFRATCNGSGLHQFTVTYEEHLNNVCK